MNIKYQIIFKGETLPGFNPGDVQKRLARLFGVDEARVGAFFAGTGVFVKKDLDLKLARQYYDAFVKVGAKAHVSPPFPGQRQASSHTANPNAGSTLTTGRYSLGLIKCGFCQTIQEPTETCKKCGKRITTLNNSLSSAPTVTQRVSINQTAGGALPVKKAPLAPQRPTVTPTMPTRSGLTSTTARMSIPVMKPPPVATKPKTVAKSLTTTSGLRQSPLQKVGVSQTRSQTPVMSKPMAPQRLTAPTLVPEKKQHHPSLSQSLNTSDIYSEQNMQALARKQAQVPTIRKIKVVDESVLSRKSVLSIQLGMIALIAVYVVDWMLERIGIDITRAPYLISVLFFMYGSWYYAKTKAYPGVFGALLGSTTLLGLAILILLPERSEERSHYSFDKFSWFALVLVLLSGIWGFEQVMKLNAGIAFNHRHSQIERLRSDYPAGIVETRKETYARLSKEIEDFILDGMSKIEKFSFRSNEISFMSDAVFGELSKYLIWIEYQRYMHYRETQKIPDYLAEDEIQQRFVALKTKIDRRLVGVDHPRLHQAYNDWFLGFDRDQGKESIVSINNAIEQIQGALLNYILAEGRIPRSLDNLGKFKPDLKALYVQSVELSKDGVVTLVTKKNKDPEISEKTIVMALYMRKIEGSVNKNDLNPEFIRIGGSLKNKYIYPNNSVLANWQSLGEN